MQLWLHVILGAIRFEDSIKGGQVSARGAVHMAAALAGCRKALVGTGWTISHLVDTNGHRKGYSAFLGAPFLALQAVFSQEEHLLVRGP